MNDKPVSFLVTCFFALATLMPACKESRKHAEKKDKGSNHNSRATSLTANNNTGNEADCDTSLFKYVYNNSRLEILELCKQVTGTIKEMDADRDGDEHMLLKLDDGQEDLLRKKNIKKKEGCLVIEVICANEVLVKKALRGCDGYTNNIKLPKVGDHVKISGSFVLDSHNGWTEIHPVSKIELIR